MLIEASNVACPTMVEQAQSENLSSTNVVALMLLSVSFTNKTKHHSLTAGPCVLKRSSFLSREGEKQGVKDHFSL